MSGITVENYDKVSAYDYISTLSGKKVQFLDPKPEQIELEDIVIALSNNCRYAGHVNTFYSVAEHSVLMCEYFLDRNDLDKAFTALMHDATEAYLVDIPRPIKPHLGGYLEMEARLQEVIFEKFDVKPMCDAVKWLDCNIVRDEVKVLHNVMPDWAYDYEECGVEIIGEVPEHIANRFRLYFHMLYTQRQGE